MKLNKSLNRTQDSWKYKWESGHVNELFAKQSSIGYIIKIAGVVVIAWGFIQGIISLVMVAQMGGHYNEWGDLQYSNELTGTTLFAFLGIVATHFLYGLLIIGFGEVIDYLQKIYFCMNPEAKQQWEEERKEKEKEKEIVAQEGETPSRVQQEVKAYYEKEQLVVQSIEKTINPSVFKVSVDGRIEYIEVGNSEPRILTDEEVAKFIQ
jgi:hypothetical protein